MAAMRGKKKIPVLIKALASEDKEMRLVAVRSLAAAGDEQAVPALIAVLQDSEVPLDALIATARSLGRIGDARGIAALHAFLQRGDLPTERTFRSIPGVNSAIEDARWQLELAAAEALARLGAPDGEVQTVVRPYLEDERAYVRRYADKVLQDAGIVHHE